MVAGSGRGHLQWAGLGSEIMIDSLVSTQSSLSFPQANAGQGNANKTTSQPLPPGSDKIRLYSARGLSRGLRHCLTDSTKMVEQAEVKLLTSRPYR